MGRLTALETSCFRNDRAEKLPFRDQAKNRNPSVKAGQREIVRR